MASLHSRQRSFIQRCRLIHIPVESSSISTCSLLLFFLPYLLIVTSSTSSSCFEATTVQHTDNLIPVNCRSTLHDAAGVRLRIVSVYRRSFFSSFPTCRLNENTCVSAYTQVVVIGKIVISTTNKFIVRLLISSREKNKFHFEATTDFISKWPNRRHTDSEYRTTFLI